MVTSIEYCDGANYTLRRQPLIQSAPRGKHGFQPTDSARLPAEISTWLSAIGTQLSAGSRRQRSTPNFVRFADVHTYT